MRKVDLTARKSAAHFIAGAVACLFLLQSFAFIASNTEAASASGRLGAALSFTVDICGADHAGDKDRPDHHRPHCALCITSNRDLSLSGAVALVATILVLALPQSDGVPAWIRRDDPTPAPVGWASSWSSRAPPSFS